LSLLGEARRALAAAAVLALAGCHSEAAPPSQPAKTAPAPPLAPVAPDAGEDLAVPLPTLDALALLASSLAPGMRELTRGESRLPATIRIERSSSDTCVRAVLAGSGSVIGAFKSGDRTLDVTGAGAIVHLGEGGPVCLMKDREARIEVQGDAASLRYVVWVSP